MSVPPDKVDPRRQFIGIDNLNPETNLRPGYMRDAVNVDVRRDGSLPGLRQGSAEFYAGTHVHSLWGDGVFPWALFVDAGSVCGIQRRADTPTVFVTGLGARPMSFARVNDAAFWSNGNRGGMIRLDGEALPWACEAAPGQPVLTAVTGLGGLDAGEYQVAITFRDSLGREGGTPSAAVVTVAQGGGIQLSSIPQPGDASVTTVRIYATPTNGDVLQHVRDIAVGTTTLTIGAGPRGVTLQTQFHEPVPFGHLIAFGHGRVLSMDDKVLRWSESMRYAQGVLAHNYLRFPGRGAVLATVGDGTDGAGTFVAAGKRTYWLRGANPKDWTQGICYMHGAVEGTLAWASGSVWGLDTEMPVPSWLATDGQFCVGLPGGQVRTFNANTVAADSGERGASLIREHAGLRQCLTTLAGPMTSSMGMRDRATATVHRNGIEI